MKILIAVDIEGIAGITNSREYEHFEFGREWCTLDTNAAIEGALAGGACEIIVSDTHGCHNDNILFDKLHSQAWKEHATLFYGRFDQRYRLDFISRLAR